MRKARTIALSAGAGALTAAFVAAMTTSAPAATYGHGTAATPAITLKPGVKVISQARALGTPWTYNLCEQNFGIRCFTPDDLRAAYNLAPLYKKGITGKGSTILIVDSIGSPTIQNDLSVFDKTFGYPAPPSFKIVAPDGPVPAGNLDWAGETTLDVEYSHTVAPGANIVLIETPTEETEGVTGFPEINAAIQKVIDHPKQYGITGKIDVISQSFGATEETFTSYSQLAPYRQAYIDAARHGISVTASTGDTGATNYRLDGSSFYSTPVTGWPATDPLVTAVGGTQIQKSSTGYSQVTWNDTFDSAANKVFGTGPLATGGGVSEFFRLPAYQLGVAGTIAKATGEKWSSLKRAIPDVSMSGACDGAVTYYESFTSPGWHLVCGTSEASPEFAGIIALAAQQAGHPLGLVNPYLYALSAMHAPGLVDVTSGNNTVAYQNADGTTTTVTGYSAGKHYDLASGVGTVNAALFVPELARLAGAGQ
jgi:subtilase family serine protease